MSPQQHADRVEQATKALNETLIAARRDGMVTKVELQPTYDGGGYLSNSAEHGVVSTSCALAFRPTPNASGAQEGAMSPSPYADRQR